MESEHRMGKKYRRAANAPTYSYAQKVIALNYHPIRHQLSYQHRAITLDTPPLTAAASS